MNQPNETTPAPPELRILILDDSTPDAELIQHALRKMNMPFTARVCASEPDFRQALAEFEPVVILSDHMLPGFSGEEALALARQLRPDAPFIFVSGAIGEETVASLLRDGATDFVAKHNLSRLEMVVTRALREMQVRLEARRAVEGLRETIEVLRGTKRAFKSKTLGDLRERLEYLVNTVPWW
jgi:two-component system sensor kinase